MRSCSLLLAMLLGAGTPVAAQQQPVQQQPAQQQPAQQQAAQPTPAQQQAAQPTPAQQQQAQPPPGEPTVFATRADRAFEQRRWQDAIREYRNYLEDYPDDRLSWLRIAQAERELGRHEQALATLEQAHAAQAPEAAVELERARNLLALGREDEGLTALEMSDHVNLRALGLLESAKDFDDVRGHRRFRDVYRHVRERVFPCEAIPEADELDFWVGDWEVRYADGTLAGRNTITKRNGDCSIHEDWRGNGAATGTSVTFFQPSRGQWRQIWTGSNGTMFDIAGGVADGVATLEGTIEYVQPNQVVAFRGTLTRISNSAVRQRLEQFDAVLGTWTVWFDGFYRRVD